MRILSLNCKRLCLIMIPLVMGVYGLGFFSSFLWQQARMVSSQRKVPIYRVETGERELAITIDGVWGAEYTPEILDILEEHQLSITFFFGNHWLEEYPELAREIDARGHEIGNHTATHPHLSQLSSQEIKEELLSNEALITELTNKRPRFFRPPFGDYSDSVIRVAEELEYQTIQWNIDSLDWKNPGADFIVRRIMDQVAAGDIILMHNNAPDTPGALRELIPALQEEGYRLVPLSELVLKKNYYIESHSGVQRPLLQPEGGEANE